MSTQMSQRDCVLEFHVRRGRQIMEAVVEDLRTGGRDALAEFTWQSYEWLEPLLVRGHHVNPADHAAVVTDNMVKIMLGELQAPQAARGVLAITEPDLKIGIFSALAHDVGNAFEVVEARKIRSSDVRTNPSLRDQAIGQRTRHMCNGAAVTGAIMRAAGSGVFSEDDIARVTQLVENHDAPTLAEFVEAKDKADYLFLPSPQHPLEEIYPLSVLLRESDRLYMLQDVVIDIKRDLLAGKPWAPHKRLLDNCKRHKEERLQYKECLVARGHGACDAERLLDSWGFDRETFYRTSVGKQRFLDLKAEGQSLTNDDWIEKVVECWFISP